jgi:hypothetical protein
MVEELYNSKDFCRLVEQYEELEKENAELTADKNHLIQAAMDGGDRYHYTAHDIGYRDLERKVKALEADYSISNRELLILSVELARRDEIIARLKEDAERLASTYVVEVFPHEWVCRGGCHHWARFGEQIDHAPDCPITLHRALMKELK